VFRIAELSEHHARSRFMTKAVKPIRYRWAITILAITLAVAVTIGVWFLVGRQSLHAPDHVSNVCQHLQRGKISDCIALRSAVAAEEGISIARWSLWLTFGSLVASSFALIGLIFAFLQGQRTVALAAAANRIATENSRVQARAYVVVQSVECQLGEHGQLKTRVKFQNSGLSPARRLRWLYNAHLAVTYAEGEGRGLVLGTEPELEKSHWRQDIPSAEAWTSASLALRHGNDAEVAALLEGAVFIAVTVKVVADYEDVFGTSHREVACFQGRLARAAGRYNELERAQDDVFDEKIEGNAA
jgi:hypothetical protein